MLKKQVQYFYARSCNKKICFTSLIFNQIHNKFHFREVFSQNRFQTFIEKFNRLKGRLRKCKKCMGCVTSTFPEKITPSRTFHLFLSEKSLSGKVRQLSLSLCQQFLSTATDMVSTANITKIFEPGGEVSFFYF